MGTKSGSKIPDLVLHARFVRALPDEYAHVKETLLSMKDRNRAEIVRLIGAWFSNLPQKIGGAGIIPAARTSVLFG